MKRFYQFTDQNNYIYIYIKYIYIYTYKYNIVSSSDNVKNELPMCVKGDLTKATRSKVEGHFCQLLLIFV